MKSAKEWAEIVVAGPKKAFGRWIASLHDAEQSVEFEDPLAETVTSARGIIERLVERAQADARAPLEEEVARLRAENERLNAEHADYLAFIADANDMLAEEHEQARRLGE